MILFSPTHLPREPQVDPGGHGATPCCDPWLLPERLVGITRDVQDAGQATINAEAFHATEALELVDKRLQGPGKLAQLARPAGPPERAQLVGPLLVGAGEQQGVSAGRPSRCVPP